MRWMALVLLALVTAGCARGEGGGGETLPNAAPPAWTEATCPEKLPDTVPGSPQLRTGGIPDGFATQWVLRCRDDFRDVPGDGRWHFRIVERADTPAPDLVAQLRRPSDPPGTGPCTAILIIPPYIALVDANGKAVLPTFPVTSCNQPRPEATKAVDTLRFQVVSETKVRQLASQQSVDTGCGSSWKDAIEIEKDTAKPGPAKALWPTPPSSLRICVYQPKSADIVGDFVAGSTATGDAAAGLAKAFEQAGPAAPCAQRATQFAILTPDGKTALQAAVELDGCRRLLRPDHTFGQLDETTVVTIGK